MNAFDLPTSVRHREPYARSIAHLRERGVRLPTFTELAFPASASRAEGPDALFHLHWYNAPREIAGRRVPDHLILPPELTGVPAKIVVMLGRGFPMIRAHKVLAAYACLVLRLASGEFDLTRQRAIWPSTGNYCRGGVAISRLLGGRGVAVLPEGMSAERFAWLDQWVSDPSDVIRTPGSESNVKEIYDACEILARDPQNVIFNQFSEFPNYLAHRFVTAEAGYTLIDALAATHPKLNLAAFVAGTGSAGTLGAGDALKERCGARIVAVEPLECPTLLYNGFGEHNIQGIGDKHVPLIHNVTNTDMVAAVSDRAVMDLDLTFNTESGRKYLTSRAGVPAEIVRELGALGFSGIGNTLAAIKVAKRLELGPDDAILTIGTDEASLYSSERSQHLQGRFRSAFDELDAAQAFGRWALGAGSDHVAELDHAGRNRIFNLGYYTWVEQRGIDIKDFNRRRSQDFWRGLAARLPEFDEMIARANRDLALQPAA